MKRAPFALFLLVLAGCSGGLPALQVTLVDGIGEPLQPLAAAWRLGAPPFAWNALPTGQFSWSLPIPPGARFQVAFRCPSAGSTDFYVSLDLRRSEVGNQLMVRCPSVYASPLTSTNGTLNVSLTSGQAFSARHQVAVSGSTFTGLQVPQGNGREVAVFGDSGGTPHFGRLGALNITGPTNLSLTLSPITATLNVTTPPGFFSYAGLVLQSFVPVDLASWTGLLPPGTPQPVPRPALQGGDLFQFWTCHGFSCAILRELSTSPAVAPGASLNLNVPPLTLSGSETHTPTALPTFSNITTSGFSPGLSFLGYALLLAEPGVRYWRHFLSPGALGNATSYYVDVENAPGFAGVVPTVGSSVQLRATAFAGNQPLAVLLAQRPIPEETFAAHTLFLDRFWPVHLEAALLSASFTW
ncbi:ArsR family transcriptional regulator [Meiothermus sp. QL-1]|uniref:ArsR family transcriptional regulator n=1 Tax=Meiothermus sp. QL-1 TaxID=2058095 RepID=UPI000E0C0817|nr:ArsR family transcriptional regulator [Meiothermus sp. QL-1]RDI96209.1 ArsR family transcriptional regulator [Meiothermus sp. QL-1]